MSPGSLPQATQVSEAAFRSQSAACQLESLLRIEMELRQLGKAALFSKLAEQRESPGLQSVTSLG